MKDADMRHRGHRSGPYQLDHEMVLVTLYLDKKLPPDLWELIDQRLAEDEDFYDRAWPLIKAFNEEPSHAVDEARLRRSVERVRASVGRTPEGELIVPAADGQPLPAPLTRSVTPPPALPVAVIPRIA